MDDTEEQSTPANEPINYMDLQAFIELGYLQEVNRVFFHPLGLALEVFVDNEGNYSLGGIWDYRDDPEGIFFAENPRTDKAFHVTQQFLNKSDARRASKGYVIQPTGEDANGNPEATQDSN